MSKLRKLMDKLRREERDRQERYARHPDNSACHCSGHDTDHRWHDYGPEDGMDRAREIMSALEDQEGKPR